MGFVLEGSVSAVGQDAAINSYVVDLVP